MAIVKWIGGHTSGQYSAAVAGNWSPSFPTNGDDVYIEGRSTNYSITSGLTALSTITLNSFNIAMSYTGTIGTADTGTSSTTTGYLSIGGTNSSAITANIGYQTGGTSAGQGGNLWRLNFGAMLATVNVTNSAQSSAMSNAGPVTILGSHSANTMNILSGTVSVAADPTETATFQTITNRGNLNLGAGTTLGTVTNSGVSFVRTGVDVFIQTGGSTTFSGSGTVGTMTVQGGSVLANSTGLITQLNIYAANVSFAGNPAPRTVTTINGYAGGALNLNNGIKDSVTLTNGVQTYCGPGQFTITPWFGSKFALS